MGKTLRKYCVVTKLRFLYAAVHGQVVFVSIKASLAEVTYSNHRLTCTVFSCTSVLFFKHHQFRYYMLPAAPDERRRESDCAAPASAPSLPGVRPIKTIISTKRTTKVFIAIVNRNFTENHSLVMCASTFFTSQE